MSECAVLTIALAVLAQPVLARTYLNCSTRKVVLISAPSGDTSSAREEDLGFWVDDEAKTLTFLDNTPLTVTRLDRFWISADRDGIYLTNTCCRADLQCGQVELCYGSTEEFPCSADLSPACACIAVRPP